MMKNKVTDINRNVNCPRGRKECGFWPKTLKSEEEEYGSSGWICSCILDEFKYGNLYFLCSLLKAGVLFTIELLLLVYKKIDDIFKKDRTKIA